MAKKTISKNPGLTAEQLRDFPIDFGNFDLPEAEWGFLPAPALQHLKFGHFSELSIKSIESALVARLDAHQRPLLDFVCSLFVFSCVLKPVLPAANRYLREIAATADDISERMEELVQLLWVSEDTMAKPRAGRGLVTTAKDHFLVRGMIDWRTNTDALRELASKVRTEGERARALRSKTKGADGHYELRPFLFHLLHFARLAGDDLAITSQEFRAEPDPKVNKKTRLVQFVEAVFKALSDEKDAWICQYELTEERAIQTRALVDKLLNKTTGNLLRPLVGARLQVEGARRAKGMRQT